MNRKKAGIILLVLVIAAAGILIRQNTRPAEVTNYDVAFEEEQEKSEGNNAEQKIEEGIQIPGYKSIQIPAGTKDVSVELTNPEENKVYFEISFYLPDTKETIYKSRMIKPGQTLYDITLEKEMEAGEYPLTVKYATYTADENMTPRNGAKLNCTLIVKE